MPPLAQGRAEAEGCGECRAGHHWALALLTAQHLWGTGQVCLGGRISSGPGAVSCWNSVKFTSQIAAQNVINQHRCCLELEGNAHTSESFAQPSQQYLSILEAESSRKN